MRTKLTRRISLVALLLLVSPRLFAQPVEIGSGWLLEWNPTDDLYPRYVADPRRSRNIAALMQAMLSDIPGSGDFRFLVAIGDQHSLARLYHREAPGRAWQLDVEARYYAQFDIENALDEVGHDERLGLIVSRRLDERLAARLMFFHTSSHMGDEYILRNRLTEQERVSSRKEEFAAGLSYRINDRWRTYGEIGCGVNLGRLNKPWRVQSGLEYREDLWPRPLGTASIDWYSGLNATTWQENDWELSTTLQAGLLARFPGSDRTYRLGIELYDGRSQLDAFFQFRESYVTVGFWLDL